MGFIYKITNTVTNKCYIGETKEKNPEERYKQHLNVIRRGKGCPALRGAIKKYGEDKFKFQVLIICFDEDRFIYEKEYIQKYNSMVPNGYNILEGGSGGAGFKGKKHTAEIIEKIREASRKRLETSAQRLANSQRIKDHYKNPENRIKQSNAMKVSEKFKQAVKDGRVGGNSHKSLPSEDIKKKISNSLKNYYTDENIKKLRESMAKARGKSVSQYTTDGTLLATYKSISEAGRALGKSSNNSINLAVSGKHKTAYGFVWKYQF